MPELPEVETIARGLRQAALVNRRVTDVRLSWARAVLPHSPSQFRDALINRRVVDIRRRGKYLGLVLDNRQWLLVHLRMSGRMQLMSADEPGGLYDRITLCLDDHRTLRLHDPRKFARMRLSDGPRSDPLRDLGVEPLSTAFTVACLRSMLAHRHRMIKPLLLDQHHIAGIGNIYADEALWAAGIHPMRRSDTLIPSETIRLHRAIRRILRRAVQAGGTSLGHGNANFLGVGGRRGDHIHALRVFRRQGHPCPRCRTTLQRLVVAQRGTHVCPACQPPPGLNPGG